MMRDFQGENPSIMFEGGLKKAIEESNNYLKEIYGAENLTIKDSKGMDRETVIVIPKDIHHLVNTLAEKYEVSRPAPSLGMDGGNGKFIITLHLFDLDNPGRGDLCEYESGGRRRSLIVAAVDGCTENSHNVDLVLHKLDLENLEHEESIFAGDQKCGNLVFKIGSHGSLCSCLYCTGCKIHDDTGKDTTEKAMEWREGIMRTPEQIAEQFKKYEEKWKGKMNTARAKADIKNFSSVQGIPKNLPAFMWTRVNLLNFPPDALHVNLLGKKFQLILT